MSPFTLCRRLWRSDRGARFAAAGCFAAVALAATVLVVLAAVPSGLRDRAERTGWRGPEASPLVAGARGTVPRDRAPVLVATTTVRIGGHDLHRTDVAATADTTPPPGLPRVPTAGELVVSPRVAAALRTDPLLRRALPGRVVGVLGPRALTGPDEWAAAVGRSRPELAAAGPAVVGLPSAANRGGVVAQPLFVVLCWIALGIVAFPAAALAAQVARLQAGRRTRRLAALRLAGASRSWVLRAAVLETTLLALAGALAGGLAGIGLTRLVARLAVDGTRWWADGLLPPSWALAAAALALPALVAGSTLASVRHAARDPFAAAREPVARRPGHWRLLLVPLVLGAAPVALSLAERRQQTLPLLVVLALGVVTVVLVGAWLVATLGRGFGRTWRRPRLLLASRRMRAHPAAVWRTASGPVLAAFAAATVLAMVPALAASDPEAPADTVAVALPAASQASVAAAVRRAAPQATVATPGAAASAALAGRFALYDVDARRLVTVTTAAAPERAVAAAALAAAAPGRPVLGAGQPRPLDGLNAAIGLGAAVCLALTALLAAVATALAAVGGVLDRRRTLAALRLAGAPVAALDRALRAEVTLATTLGTVGAGLAGLGFAGALLAMGDLRLDPAGLPAVGAAVLAAAALPWAATWLVRPVLARNTEVDAVRA